MPSALLSCKLVGTNVDFFDHLLRAIVLKFKTLPPVRADKPEDCWIMCVDAAQSDVRRAAHRRTHRPCRTF